MKILTKTWICSRCPYRWQFSGEAANVTPYDLTPAQLAQQFPEHQFLGLTAGKCPNCYLQGVGASLGLSVDNTEMSTVKVASITELESMEVEDLDDNGQPIMVQTGERQEIGIVNGQIGIITVPVYETKMVPISEEKLAELKLQRDQSLDALAAIAVKEV